MMNNLSFLARRTALRTTLSISMLILAITVSNSALANDVAGKTILAKGQVEAFDQANKEKRTLRRRSEIFNVDNIITGDKSKAQFSMSDGGLITLKENTNVLISNYKFDPEGGESSATLELVNGGLRSISGLIKKSGGDYQVKTPVGSIGIRGTHFAVEVVGDDVVFAVYSGSIDVQLTNQTTLSLGSTEDFSFASVNIEGEVTRMTQAPASISLGYSGVLPSKKNTSAANENTDDGQALASVIDSSSESPITEDSPQNDVDVIEDLGVYSESEWQGGRDLPIAELIAERTGTLSYSNISQSTVNSSVGQVSDFAINMTVDFDNASVPQGSLSFTDSQGQWFAAYSGLINVDQLDLGVNFASHGNNRADGIIFAAFSDGLDEIFGGFNLQEINNPSVNAEGSFKINP